MTPTHLAAGGSGSPEIAASVDGQTVVVGVKLDARSKELLTWSLLKLAAPGDRVVALHVMANHEIVDPDGKSALLSVVEAFDSVLNVYEGFCNLKQVDLKLKICSGSSIGKVLVREVESCSANKLILGIASKHHKFKSSASVAKYCAKKLSKACSVLAVHNGKIMFHREASLHVAKTMNSRGSYAHETSKLNEPESVEVESNSCSDGKGGTCEELEQFLIETNSDCRESAFKESCSICSPVIHDGSEDCHVTKQEDKILIWQTLSSEREDSDPSLLCQSSMDGENSSSMTQLNSDDEDAYSDMDGEDNDMIQEGNEAFSAIHTKDDSSLSLELGALHEKYSSKCRLFTYQELELATSNFAPENLIGKGGNSRVYQGCLPDGKKLAVKILRQYEDVLKDFVFEIDIITSLCHKNIISLFGFCFEDNKLLLVYDLLPRGSLEENLYESKKDPSTFGWNERYKVAVGVAKALNYLHKCNGQPVIHRDVKSSNILLSDNFEPQLSDFGLAKRASTSNQKAFCDIAGTFGYLAPEYFMFGKVTDKIDVYAYGVVLLELLSGRKPISSEHPKGQESLVMWAKPMLNGEKVTQLLDPSLGPNDNLDQMERMVLAANLCIRRSPRARPKMTLVLKLIQGDPETMKWARLQFNTTDNPGSPSSIQCHLNLALLDVEDDSLSVSSFEQNVSLEEYLNGRSRSSSFD
ncbi:hypothetical protein V2J09_007276 [Rumex salicifolius]